MYTANDLDATQYCIHSNPNNHARCYIINLLEVAKERYHVLLGIDKLLMLHYMA